MGRQPSVTQTSAGGASAQTQNKGPEQQATAAGQTPRRWRARTMCFDGTLYQPGAERTSAADLDPDVWEEL